MTKTNITASYWYKNYEDKEIEAQAIQETVATCMNTIGRQQIVNDALNSFRGVPVDESDPYELGAKEVLITLAKTKVIENKQMETLIRFLIERSEDGYCVNYAYIFDTALNIA